MTMPRDLTPLIVAPREDLANEYKSWLDLKEEHDKAVLAKAAIALANHGGGFIVVGFEEDQNKKLISIPCPVGLPSITQDAVSGAIRRYAEPEFHCQVHNVPHPTTGVEHVVIVVPSSLAVPVMSTRDYQKDIAQNRCYIRKPGPRSEEPHTREEWRTLLGRCVRENRNEMLDAIRGIVLGSVGTHIPTASALDELKDYCNDSHKRWLEKASSQPHDSPARFPHGYYEVGFSLVNASPADGVLELRNRLDIARRIKLTGWSIFLDLVSDAKPYGEFIETWLTPESLKVSTRCDFWRASQDGKLYTIREYVEDDDDYSLTGQVIDIGVPIWRVGEGLLYAARFAETFDAVDGIAVRCHFTGLQGRRLDSLFTGYPIPYSHISHMDEFVLSGEYTLQQIRDNLAEVLYDLLKDFYASFDFFELRLDLVQREVNKLQSRRY